MAQYDSSFSGAHNDEYNNRITVLENKLQALEQMTDGEGFSGKWNISISGSQGHLIADNNAAIPSNALLQSGNNRPSTHDGDTWIFYDNQSGANTPWGIKHNQPDDTIDFYGSGVVRTSINLSNGFVNTNGAYGFYQFSGANGCRVNSSTSQSGSITITSHGRPIFIVCTADMNPLSAGSWDAMQLYRGSTLLARQEVVGASSSYNSAMCIAYLDIVGAGTYTYQITISSGSGDTQLAESSAACAPHFCVFEI